MHNDDFDSFTGMLDTVSGTNRTHDSVMAFVMSWALPWGTGSVSGPASLTLVLAMEQTTSLRKNSCRSAVQMPMLKVVLGT